MASTAQKRAWWANYRCDSQKMERVTFPGEGRTWSLIVAAESAPAWELFASLMRKHDYPFRESAGGTYNCRKIGGTNSWSLHAYGIALDLNPSKNPYGTKRHDFPQGFIDDVEATGLFRWGIEFDDPMHWEIDVPPSEIGDDMKPPSWAVAATQWHIDRGIYSESSPDDVDESEEFHRQSVFRHRFYNAIKGEFGSGTHDHDGRYIKSLNISVDR